MRMALKMVLPLIISVAVVSLLFAGYQVRTQRRILRNDLSRRAEILGQGLQVSIEPLLDKPNDKALQRLLDRFEGREHLKGVAVYSPSGATLAITPGISTVVQTWPDIVKNAITKDQEQGQFVRDQILDKSGNEVIVPLHIQAVPLHSNGEVGGALALYDDTSYVDVQLEHTLRDSLLNAFVQTLLITGLALILVRWTFMRPLRRTAHWLRTLRTGSVGGAKPPPGLPDGELFDQLHHEVTHLARDLNTARATAEEEARLRDTGASIWTGERLRVSLQNKLNGTPLFVVSNREPYVHTRGSDGSIQVTVPASGLVTALEPVLLACNGTWVANGTGNADREVVDANDHLRIPPDLPSYTLRRVWLTPEEERGFYEGFSNEGLWALCHIAHNRPLFRPEDWIQYQRINRRFADVVLQEMEGTESPILLAQDYHFALLPRMVKDARPDARVAIFWHIPWPNQEMIGICPWQKELVDGLLGADLIGFHIQTHCNNFLETVDHSLEALTEWDRFAVNRNGHVTRVRPYPISVAFPEASAPGEARSSATERAAICRELGIEASLLGIGVDRVDYTKGIIERFRAIERFLELYPAYQRRFSLVQIGAPSRTDILRYRTFLEEVSAEAERINAKFHSGRWKPIVLLKWHHSHEEIARYYRAASVCLVTSLHDGMNLVAKEFVASREDEEGVLILSTFAGAAHELTDALLVNPYDISQLSDAIHQALEMPEAEQIKRMQWMRGAVKEHNIFRWAANLLSDLTEIRIETPERGELRQPQWPRRVA
jgi:trehalose-6-phosphate synthase